MSRKRIEQEKIRKVSLKAQAITKESQKQKSKKKKRKKRLRKKHKQEKVTSASPIEKSKTLLIRIPLDKLCVPVHSKSHLESMGGAKHTIPTDPTSISERTGNLHIRIPLDSLYPLMDPIVVPEETSHLEHGS